jgi:hypothetical protein
MSSKLVISARPVERLLRDFENALAIPLRVRARLSAVQWERFLSHPQKSQKRLATGDSLRESKYSEILSTLSKVGRRQHRLL